MFITTNIIVLLLNNTNKVCNTDVNCVNVQLSAPHPVPITCLCVTTGHCGHQSPLTQCTTAWCQAGPGHTGTTLLLCYSRHVEKVESYSANCRAIYWNICNTSYIFHKLINHIRLNLLEYLIFGNTTHYMLAVSHVEAS